MQDWMRALAILGGTLAGATVLTLGLIWVLVPDAGPATSPSPAPSVDLAAAPEETGGSLTFSGDRTGTLTIDGSTGGGVAFSQVGDGFTPMRGPYRLTGTNGMLSFGAVEDGVTQIDFDGLSFYPDPGDCAVTLGARNDVNGLVAVRLQCAELSDVRRGGVVSVDGLLALPGVVVGERGDLPMSGGMLEVGDTTVELREVFMVGGGGIPSGRVPVSVHSSDPDHFLGLEFDPEASVLYLTFVVADGEPVALPEPCPVSFDNLGRLTESMSAMRLTIDCGGALEDGTTVRIRGTIVADSDIELDRGEP